MSHRIDELTGLLDRIASHAQAAFGGLTREPLTWKPAPDRWSVAPCLDRLITINRPYFPLLTAA